jgi:hypothetical protein
VLASLISVTKNKNKNKKKKKKTFPIDPFVGTSTDHVVEGGLADGDNSGEGVLNVAHNNASNKGDTSTLLTTQIPVVTSRAKQMRAASRTNRQRRYGATQKENMGRQDAHAGTSSRSTMETILSVNTAVNTTAQSSSVPGPLPRA